MTRVSLAHNLSGFDQTRILDATVATAAGVRVCGSTSALTTSITTIITTLGTRGRDGMG